MLCPEDFDWFIIYLHSKTHKTRVLTERKPPPMPKFQPKVIRDSNPDFRINPDPDVCRICPKML